MADTEVFIVGGAAAGLSLASCLKANNVSCIVAEKFPRCGDQWRGRYHRLHLHDIKKECHLPNMKMPDDYPTYPTRIQFAEYLDSYASKQELPVLLSHKVTSATFDNSTSLWTINVDDISVTPPTPRSFKAKHLAIANGIYNDPQIPDIPNANQYKGLSVHSANYTNGTHLELEGKRVLVVGFGNSGGEISIDLVEHGAKPTILQRSPISIMPRGFIGFIQRMRYVLEPLIYLPFSFLILPVLALLGDLAMVLAAKVYYGNVSKYHVAFEWRPPLIRLILTFNPPLIDVGTIRCIKQGKIKVQRGTIKQFVGDFAVEFSDGKVEEFDAIVYATGYSPISGHCHFLEPEVCEVIGSGFDSVRKRKIVTGQESAFPRLWFIWGRLQMIRDAAPHMAISIKKKLGYSSPKITWFRLYLLYQLFCVTTLLCYFYWK